MMQHLSSAKIYPIALISFWLFGNCISSISIYAQTPPKYFPSKNEQTFKIPSPRGRILDRNGNVLATNKTVNYVGILCSDSEREILEVVGFAELINQKIQQINRALIRKQKWVSRDIQNYFLNQRESSLLIPKPISKEEVEQLRSAQIEGICFATAFERHYPNDAMLCHVVGSHSFKSTELGRLRQDGLEKTYNESLAGKAGTVRYQFDSSSNNIKQEVLIRPQPGKDLYTTVEIEMQRAAEAVLQKHAVAGAIVIMNVHNGDILTMASYPHFNLNDFIPSLTLANFEKYSKNSHQPLASRSHLGFYQPSLTFNEPFALALLENKVITSADIEGMNVVTALAQSNNSWFARVSKQIKADTLILMPQHLGLGCKTGLPLSDESRGFIASHFYFHGKATALGPRFGGMASRSPRVTLIQNARMMAAIANEKHLSIPGLVLRIDGEPEINPEIVHPMKISKSSLNIVKQGMYNSVNSTDGAATKGAHPIGVSAIAGCREWRPNRKIDWFTGYFPTKNPVYSFAVVYEGEVNEKFTIGEKAAPMFKTFLDKYLDPKNISDIINLERE